MKWKFALLAVIAISFAWLGVNAPAQEMSDSARQAEMMAELLTWTLRAQDPLPHPRRRYKFKSDPRNYWSPHRTGPD